MKILITSAGRRVELLNCFTAAASTLGINLEIYTADLNPQLSAACQKSGRFFSVPSVGKTEYIDSLLDICRREKITLLVPTIDPELDLLSQHLESFTLIGTRVLISPVSVVEVARNKIKTAEVLERAGLPIPQTLTIRQFLKNPPSWANSIIAKPLAGSSSVGIIKSPTKENLEQLINEPYLIQEKWEGREFTVNIFFNELGRVVSVVPHERLEVRSGEVSKGITTRHMPLIAAGFTFEKIFPHARGPLCFQAIVRPDDTFCIFEINARFGGGYPLADQAGAKFAQWILEELANLPSSANNEWSEGVLMLRYDAAVFTDNRLNK
jgi:carbamoyl-phosphate synthase large subunit